jgi:hypothetical protein
MRAVSPDAETAANNASYYHINNDLSMKTIKIFSNLSILLYFVPLIKERSNPK